MPLPALAPAAPGAAPAASPDAGFAALVGAVERLDPAGDRQAAIALYRGWIDRDGAGAPHAFAAWFNLGVELARAGNRPGAAVAYRNALALRPDFHQAAINLGLLLEAGGETEAALQAWARALQPDAARTALLNHRGRLCEQAGRLAEAEQALRASLLTDPAQPDAVQHWVHLRQKLCLWPVLTDRIPGLGPDDLRLQAGPLASLALTDDITAQCQAAAAWIDRKTTAPGVRLSPPEGYRHGRIRLGYLSADFRRHALSLLIAELFERHDRARFEVFGYCASPEDGSAIRARVLGAFDRWRSVRDLSDEAAARAIRADEIDILVDLNGLTSGARLQILRWRPAPVQATYLGFVGPVPLPELDYLFCDEVVIPPASAALYRPRPLAIGRTYQANDSRRAVGPPVARAAVGLPQDAFVFCCFSNHYKITPEMFAAWTAILRQVPGAVLWLIADSEWSCRNLREAARAAGIDPARLIFAARTEPAEYMARLALADLFLDTFPYNAGTIASDAIRMGLPLVTLSGRAFAARMATRLLGSIGAAAGIATSFAEYIERAVALAADRAAYAAYRALFGEDAWAATLGDGAGFTAEYETVLRGIARRPA